MNRSSRFHLGHLSNAALACEERDNAVMNIKPAAVYIYIDFISTGTFLILSMKYVQLNYEMGHTKFFE